MTELPKKYNFKEIEAKWKTFWEKNNTYVSTFKGSKLFSVDTPPPTVSGAMHMGHAFSYAQGDFIVRFKRMTGNTIFYPFGTDDNGLPTEHLIEKKKKVNSRKMSRPEFVKLCHETIKELKPKFIQPWKDLAISCDYEHSYSTIDEQSTRISQKSFLDLYKKNKVYKKETPTTWCVKCQTAIAQADFENIEKNSSFNDIAFTDQDGKELIIATTRPELIPACVALFAHPDDKRYQHLKGKKAKVPLFNYEVPIMYDDTVAMDKGTGLMMVCTFGDKEDVEKWHKYNLDLRTVITKYGTINELGKKYEGMKIRDARKAIIQDLQESGALKNQTQIVHNANTHDRCGTEIEFQKTSQWFINVMDHKEELVKAGDNINWHPKHMKVRYVNWVENLNWDWCISRQRHFGVPFPVWYEKDTGNIVLADESELPIDPSTQTPKAYKGNPENLIPESDVLDTWATSSVTPQIALDWGGKTTDKEFDDAMPMTIRLQSHDIIRTWAFYTITKAMYNNNKIPWKNIMISGFVLDSLGKKMSKSKGNTIDPLTLIDKYGADAVRYGASAVKLGEDLPFQEKYLDTGKRLLTKLFNASKFVLMHLEDYKSDFDYEKLIPIDKWLLAKYNSTVQTANQHLEEYEFAKARSEIEKFFWHFCDYYLEIVKDRLYKPEIHGNDLRLSGQMTLSHVLKGILQLFAPYTPYLTEEIYSWSNKESIHLTSYPQYNKKYEFDVTGGDLSCEVISAARKFKNENQLSQKAELSLIKMTTDKKDILEPYIYDIKVTVSAENVEFVNGEELTCEFTVK